MKTGMNGNRHEYHAHTDTCRKLKIRRAFSHQFKDHSFDRFQFAADVLICKLWDDTDAPLCVPARYFSTFHLKTIVQIMIEKACFEDNVTKLISNSTLTFFLDFQAPEMLWLWTHAICPCITKPVYSSSHALPSIGDGRSWRTHDRGHTMFTCNN